MTNKAYNLIVMVLKYGQINFWGGNNTLDFDDYRKLDKELYYRICEAIEELAKENQYDEEAIKYWKGLIREARKEYNEAIEAARMYAGE